MYYTRISLCTWRLKNEITGRTRLMALSVRFNERDEQLVKNYAALNNMSLSDFIRNAVMEKIEDECDLAAYDKAIAEFKKDPVTYSLKEVKKLLEID